MLGDTGGARGKSRKAAAVISHSSWEVLWAANSLLALVCTPRRLI